MGTRRLIFGWLPLNKYVVVSRWLWPRCFTTLDDLVDAPGTQNSRIAHGSGSGAPNVSQVETKQKGNKANAVAAKFRFVTVSWYWDLFMFVFIAK